MYQLTPSPERAVLGFIDEIPAAFFRLSALTETLHADLGVAGAHRTVLKWLFLDGEQTAPDLARRKLVTRQAIQPILDDLAARGLIETVANPRHRRSSLYRLTAQGIEACVVIQKREVEEIGRLAPEADQAVFETALAAIRRLNEALSQRLEAARDAEKA
jgi:DNA-binding MarR family transcriptional regulator